MLSTIVYQSTYRGFASRRAHTFFRTFFSHIFFLFIYLILSLLLQCKFNIVLLFYPLRCPGLQRLQRFVILFEPRNNKTNKVACAPSKDSWQPGQLSSLAMHLRWNRTKQYFQFSSQTIYHQKLQNFVKH